MNDSTLKRPLVWKAAAKTDQGMIRTNNEDAVISQTHKGIWAVADGMGGHEVGEVASQLLVDHIAAISESDVLLSERVLQVEEAILQTNEQLLTYAKEKLAGEIVGSTVVALIIKGEVGVVLWAGDSRLYRYNKKGHLEQLTQDHSQVAELVEQGFIDPSEAESHPDANIITRAVGVKQDLLVDAALFQVYAGDNFLLCSDGLYNCVEDNILEYTLGAHANIEIAVDELMRIALADGAPDNVSIILVRGEYDSTT